MKIDLVTFTGADESVTPDQIIHVTEEYPTIKTEWALLVSKNNVGKRTRYPSLAWMEKLVKDTNLRLAGHFQGIWLREMCEGNFTFAKAYPILWAAFQRIQLNFHGNLALIIEEFYKEAWKKQFIFQMDGVNEEVYHSMEGKVDVVPLFDTSAGAGVVPDSWPKPLHATFNGYAGGLGPNTLKEQLKKIEEAAGDAVIWLDMETRIRSNDDMLFDLDKCRKVLDIVGEN
jgi:phosphoribosylanthranilate isomerase